MQPEPGRGIVAGCSRLALGRPPELGRRAAPVRPGLLFGGCQEQATHNAVRHGRLGPRRVATVSPSFTAISEMMPETGALTSSVTLSVSSSATASSAFTASPAFLNHLPTVASVTNRPAWGQRFQWPSTFPEVRSETFSVHGSSTRTIAEG